MNLVLRRMARKMKRGLNSVINFLMAEAGIKPYDAMIRFDIPSGKRQAYSQRGLDDMLFDNGFDCEFRRGNIWTYAEDVDGVKECLETYGCRNIRAAKKGGRL